MNEPKKFARVGKPFDAADAAHAVVRAAEALGWNFGDPQALLRRAQHVEYGLSAEIEFAAILRWLGWCPFVHRLSEDALKDPAYHTLQIPDLFAVFRLGDDQCTALIEAKTGDELTLKFKKSYLDRLHNYAKLLSQPLLVAWRPRPIGMWTLFEPTIAEPIDEEHVQVSLDLAFKHDLMSVLAGDYILVPEKGAGLRIEAERIGEKRPTPSGYEAPFQISDAYIVDAKSVRVEDLPNSIMSMILSAMEYQEEVTDNTIVQTYLASGGITRAQLVLRTAAEFSLSEGERIHWKVVGSDFNAILKSDTLLADAKARFGTFVQYIFHQQPQNVPGFMPRDWRGRAGR